MIEIVEPESAVAEAIAAEAARYLEAVELFRSEGREPCWTLATTADANRLSKEH